MIGGELHVDKLQEDLTLYEQARWQAFLSAREQRRDKLEIYLARLIWRLGQIFGAEETMDDVLIQWDKPPAEKDEVTKLSQEELALGLAAMMGAKIIDKRKKTESGK